MYVMTTVLLDASLHVFETKSYPFLFYLDAANKTCYAS